MNRNEDGCLQKVWRVSQTNILPEGDFTHFYVCDTETTADSFVRKLMLEDLAGDDDTEELIKKVEEADIETALDLWGEYRGEEQIIEYGPYEMITSV